nr:zinc ABC transporter ATP-binding protein AztA [Microbacterium hydrocarbonoxydans]
MMIPTAELAPLATLTNIHVDYDGRDVLCGVDITLRRGELLAIAGPNGAGKSTLLEVLAGVHESRVGERSVNGSLAFVPQRAGISERLPVTVRDVVSVGLWGRLGWWRRPDAAARDVIDRSMARLDIGTLASASFSALSGGQQQRALLAQGLARSADLLLLDEPTTGLDVESALLIRAALRDEVRRGVAVVCVSHDTALLTDADRVIRLREGVVVTDSDP